MTNDMPRRFRGKEQLDQTVTDFVAERRDPICDVPACSGHWVDVRKLGWSDGGRVVAIAMFLCAKHIRMNRRDLLREAPTGIGGFDTAPIVGEVAPWN